MTMPKSGYDPAFDNLNSYLDLGFGEKRGLQIVRVTRQRFSQLHTPSIP